MSKPVRQSKDYERVNCGDFIQGIIEEVEEDLNHKFKKFNNPQEEETFPAVRFKFRLEGYQFAHYSRWNKFTYGEKSNLYLKYLLNLVEGAVPDMDFDIQELKGMPIKVLWSEKNDFQAVETIRPIKSKIVPKTATSGAHDAADIAIEPAESIESIESGVENEDGLPF